MVGLGFAMVENIYYFLNVYAEGGSGALGVNIVMRAIVFGLNHAMFTSMTGLGIAVARLSPRKSIKLAAPFAGWSAAVFTHFIHNLSASIGGLLCLVSLFNAWGGLLLMGIIVVWALVQERQWLRTYLEEEVERGTLSRQQYSRTHSSWRALSHRVSLLFNQGLSAYLDATRFYHRCSELAYKKHHLATLNDTKSGEMIARLRDEVGQLSRNLG
jgi:hypothetical protein